MRDVLLLTTGALLGGLINLGVQLAVHALDNRRRLRVAALTIHDELMEWGFLEINSEDGPQDAGRLHAVWRERRADLIGVGAETWKAVEHAVLRAVYPDASGPLPRDSHNGALEKALFLLEPHARLPSGLRAF